MSKESAQFPGNWHELGIAVVGGDDREQEIARLAAATGATVTAYGFPWPESSIESVRYASSAADALTGAHVALFPIPGMTMDGAIFATEKIIPNETLLGNMASGAHILLGAAHPDLRRCASELGIVIHEYEHDQELMLLRAPAIVEAALQVIIENTDITIHRSRICVAGQGNIGSLLGRTLVALGAYVTVAARNPVQRAYARTLGADSISINELKKQADSFDIIVSTIPAPVINSDVIDSLTDGTLLVDLAAPPGSIDLEHARKRGLKAVWARALGRRAPITVGASQWSGISTTILNLMKGTVSQ